jgi:trehalose utilization protein
MKTLLAFVVLLGAAPQDNPWVVYEGGEGPGKGKHVVLISGDEEYRSEEALPQLGKILAKHHGFKCTVLFAINKKTGEIDPNASDNIPGTEALATADLMILALRFRRLPPEQMKPIDDYVQSGKPIIGLRTSTHAFDPKGEDPYLRYGWSSKIAGWEKGFGKQVLGETWVNHHGAHGKESTRGVIAPGQEKNPIVKGCEDIWGPTDVYTVNLPLPGDSTPLVLGQVLVGMKPEDKALEGKKNDPMMPVAWTKSWSPAEGKKARVFTTTMGSSTDLSSEGLRRLVVNASYWGLGMEDKIADRAKVDIVGDYAPTPFGFNKSKKGVKPADHRM